MTGIKQEWSITWQPLRIVRNEAGLVLALNEDRLLVVLKVHRKLIGTEQNRN